MRSTLRIGGRRPGWAWAVATVLAVGALHAGDAPAPDDAPPVTPTEKVTLILHWKPQAQWAGYYVAKEKGYYARRGLDVTILPRQGRSDPLDALLDGRAQFASHFLGAGLGLRGLRHPVVLVGQMFNRSNLMVVSRKSLGVHKVSDLSNRSVAFWEGYYAFLFRSFFRAQGATNVHERVMGHAVTRFTSGQVDACSAMEYNEYPLILASPQVDKDDIIAFRLRDLGMDFPEDGIYVTETYAREKPAVCRAFVKATLEGWAFVRDHRDEAMDIVMEQLRDTPDATREHSERMVEVCVASVFPPKDSPRHPGVLRRADFEQMHRFLKSADQMQNDVDYNDFVIKNDVAYDDFVRLQAVEPAAESAPAP